MIFSRKSVLRRIGSTAATRLAQAGEICEGRLLLSSTGMPVPEMLPEVMGPAAPSSDSGTGELIVDLDTPSSEVMENESLHSMGPASPEGGMLANLAAESPAMTDGLSVWREQLRQQLFKRADEWYGNLFSQAENRGYWFGTGCDIVRVVAFDSSTQTREIFVAANTLASAAVSQTNVQVNGVDEADIVETDGEYLYLISGNQLSIVRAGGVDGTTLVSQTTLESRPIAMFLNGNRLTVLTESQPQFMYMRRLGFIGGIVDLAMPQSLTVPPSVTATVFDISDRSAPAVIQASLIDGTFIDARQIGNDLIVVVRNEAGAISLPSLNWTVNETQDDSDVTPVGYDSWLGPPELTFAQIDRAVYSRQGQSITYESRDSYLARIDALVSEMFPPSVYQQSGITENLHESLSWLADDLSTVQFDQSMLSVVRINTAGDGSEAPDVISVATAGWHTTVYVTETSVYLATPESLLFPTYREVTSIHRIDLTADDLRLAASGQIDGTIADQHSIDEHDGMLRVAVSQSDDRWVSSTAVIVLEETAGVLTVIGQVAGLAPGERLYSARFDGDRAWIVTFRQVDPLFAIDLSDPANPVVAGELKIPGYSDYMQRIDENHILTIGRDANPDTGRVTDLQISVFDVSDMSEPRLLHRYVFDVSGYEWSEANTDHHAFHWMAEAGLLAIPLTSHPSGSWWRARGGYGAEDSLAVLQISLEDGITLKGRVSQGGDVTRSLQVDDFLYSVSDMSVVVISIDDPDEILAEIPLGTGAPGFGGSSGLMEQRNLYRSSNPEDSSDPDPGVPAPESEFRTVENQGEPGELEVAALQVSDDGLSTVVTDVAADLSLSASPPLLSVPSLLSVSPIRSVRPSPLFAADAGDATFGGISARRDLEFRDEPIAVTDVVSGVPVPFSNHAQSDTSDLPQLIPAAADSESLDGLKSALDDESTDSEKDVVGQQETADEPAPDAAAPASDEPRASAGNDGAPFGNVAAAWQRHQARRRMSQAPTLRTAGWINQSDGLAGASAEIDKVMTELSETGV